MMDILTQMTTEHIERLMKALQEELDRRIRISKEANDGTN